MIEIDNITKKFGNFTAIENICINIDDSSIYGLVGYNGSGKTTLLKTCAGIYKPDTGEVRLDGENVYDNGKLRSKLFFMADEPFFERGATLLKMKKIYKGYYPDFSDKIFENMAQAMHLDVKANLQSFSKGMQKQAEIVLAMATKPKFLMLDEVFDGIDPQKRSLCKKLFIEYMAETGCSILMSSHNLQEVSDLCDHVALIDGKKLKLDVSVDDISSAYTKYRLIFNRNIDEKDFIGIPYKKLKLEERMATVIVSSSVDEAVFEKLRPIHTDCITLSLEEVFLNEMEDAEYDISSIFSE